MYRKLMYLVSLAVVMGLVNSATAELVAHWKLDEGSGDTTTATIGSPDADGILVGATWVTADAAPISGSNAAVFFESANSDRIETNYVGILGQAERTVTAWIKAEPTQNNNAVFVGWGLNNPTERYSFRLNASASNGSHWALRLEIQGSYAITQTPLNDGQWHHVAVTNPEGSSIEQVSFYVDGQLEDGLSGTSGGGVLNTASSSVVLGNSGHAVGGYGFDGAIDDVRIYNKALPEGQIQAVMQGGGTAYPYAFRPNPADGVMIEDTWAILSWKPGDFALSHDVYIGDNFEDVNNGAEGAFLGNQATTTLTLGFPGFAFPEGLANGTTYYWRIDEVNEAEPNSPWTGDVWSFSVPPKIAYFPEPADGAESVNVDVQLSWTGGHGAKLHHVYFGETFDEVDNAAGALPQGAANYTPGPLKMAKAYYWRVDEFDVVDTFKGDVWSFITEGAVASLDPANGAVNVTQTPILTWTPGLGATYDIYFGTDASSLELKGSGNLG
ncbi:MAG: LamG domain-containing protein, partial [Planctomycetota bacterium]